MFILLVAVVVIILCSIFGLTYSRTPLRAIQDGGQLSAIRLPGFMHGTPLIQHPEAGFQGDSGIATRSSRPFLEITGEGTEETSRGAVDGQLRNERYQLDRRIIDQKIRDANQLGLFTESLWPHGLQTDFDKGNENSNQNLNLPDTSKPAHQKINIYSMIQYETFKEAMAVLKHQREQEEAARIAEANLQKANAMESNERNPSNDEEKTNLPKNDKNVN